MNKLLEQIFKSRIDDGLSAHNDLQDHHSNTEAILYLESSGLDIVLRDNIVQVWRVEFSHGNLLGAFSN